MYGRIYGLYVSTFDRARAALGAADEQQLRALCRDVAGLAGLASSVALMALSDAECGRRPRSKWQLVGMSLRDAPLATGAAETAVPTAVPAA